MPSSLVFMLDIKLDTEVITQNFGNRISGGSWNSNSHPSESWDCFIVSGNVITFRLSLFVS
jgi:hypothetical protein